ncbi:MAG TPA: hypothetical protein VK002_00815 [Rubricoccaceae bacterium]|nr:hypothetical protein [Rubricoccaceae bacterium]
MANLNDDATTRSLIEAALGFFAVLLILPLAFRVLAGIFRLGIVRRLIGEAIFVGLTALLTKEGVLDRLFGQQGQTDGALKTKVNR